MTKMFKMYGDLFMEVTPQPWMMNSKTIKGRIESGRKFCVNVNTGALTCYDPENYMIDAPAPKPAKRPVFFLKVPGRDPIPLLSDFEGAHRQLKDMFNSRSMVGCLVYSDQKTLPVGFPLNRSVTDSIENVRQMYIQSYNLIGA